MWISSACLIPVLLQKLLERVETPVRDIANSKSLVLLRQTFGFLDSSVSSVQVISYHMVNVKTAGEVYALNSGKIVQWNELPYWLKDSIDAQERSVKVCTDIRNQLETCIINKGFWEENCVSLLSDYDKCQALYSPISESSKHKYPS